MSYIKIEIFDSNTNQKKIMELESCSIYLNESIYLNAINFLETEININQDKPFFKLHK